VREFQKRGIYRADDLLAYWKHGGLT